MEECVSNSEMSLKYDYVHFYTQAGNNGIFFYFTSLYSAVVVIIIKITEKNVKQNASKNYSEDVTIAVVPEITIILSLKKKRKKNLAPHHNLRKQHY